MLFYVVEHANNFYYCFAVILSFLVKVHFWNDSVELFRKERRFKSLAAVVSKIQITQILKAFFEVEKTCPKCFRALTPPTIFCNLSGEILGQNKPLVECEKSRHWKASLNQIPDIIKSKKQKIMHSYSNELVETPHLKVAVNF